MPVVASDLGGLPELVEPGRYGEIAPPPIRTRWPPRSTAYWPTRPGRWRWGGRPGPEPSGTSGPERHLERLMGLYARAGAAIGA